MSDPYSPTPAKPNTTPEQDAGAVPVTFVSESQGENFFILVNPGRKDYPNQNLLQNP